MELLTIQQTLIVLLTLIVLAALYLMNWLFYKLTKLFKGEQKAEMHEKYRKKEVVYFYQVGPQLMHFFEFFVQRLLFSKQLHFN